MNCLIEKKIIILYFCFENYKLYKQKDISCKLNLSQSIVYNVLKNILKKIKQQLLEIGTIEINSYNKKLKANKTY